MNVVDAKENRPLDMHRQPRQRGIHRGLTERQGWQSWMDEEQSWFVSRSSRWMGQVCQLQTW